jgi:hypothetical protein
VPEAVSPGRRPSQFVSHPLAELMEVADAGVDLFEVVTRDVDGVI